MRIVLKLHAGTAPGTLPLQRDAIMEKFDRKEARAKKTAAAPEAAASKPAPKRPAREEVRHSGPPLPPGNSC